MISKIENLKKYAYSKKNLLLAYIIFIVLLYGARWHSRNVSIDSVLFTNSPNTFYNWLNIGRQGLVLSKIIFSPFGYNSYWEGFLTFFAMLLMAFVLLYFFDVVIKANISKINSLIMLGIIASGVVFSLQYFFFMQIFEIYFAIVLTVVALIYIYKWIFENNALYCLGGIVLMIWAFSSYQATVPLYILCGVVGYVLYEDKELDVNINIITKLIISFIIAFLINLVITKLFFSSSDYLSGMDAWKNGQAVSNITRHISYVWGGKKGIIYNIHYKLMVVIYTILAIKNIKKASIINVLKCLAVCMLLLSPFYLTFYTGTVPVQRAQFNLVFCVAFGYMLLIRKMDKNLICKGVLISLATVNILMQSYTVLKLFYTDDVRYQADVQYAYQIAESLKQKGIEENSLPIAFIGRLPAGTNSSCISRDFNDAEYYGETVWGLHSMIEPNYYWSSQSGTTFMRTLGIKYDSASKEQVAVGRKIAKKMNCWPQKSSIKVVKNEFVVVKLSEDEYER